MSKDLLVFNEILKDFRLFSKSVYWTICLGEFQFKKVNVSFKREWANITKKKIIITSTQGNIFRPLRCFLHKVIFIHSILS